MLRVLARYIDVRRLVAVLAVLAVLGLPIYFFGQRGRDDPLVRPAVLLDTPPAPDRITKVGLNAGQRAPNFEVSTPNGTRIRLSDLRGRPVLINFWARWCTSCLSEMPNIKAVQEKLGAGAVTVVAINAGETRSEAMQFIDFLNAPFVWGFDQELIVADAYGVYGLPDSLFIDAAGVIQAVYRGHAQRATFESFIDAAIKAQPAAEPPPSLRFITTVPREHTLIVRPSGADRVDFASKSLRCDLTYCASESISRLQQVAGVMKLDQGQTNGIPTLSVRFDPKVASVEALQEKLVQALNANRDPLYDQPIEVQRGGR